MVGMVYDRIEFLFDQLQDHGEVFVDFFLSEFPGHYYNCSKAIILSGD